MKRPSLQWYPKDWRNNAKLRLCSWGARGVWTEAIGMMHDSEEYGIVRATLREIALALGAPLPLVKELATKRVMKGSDKHLSEPYIYTPTHSGRKGTPVVLVPVQDGPIWFSSRMVRDEYLRTVRGATTRFGPGNDPRGGIPDPEPMPIPKGQPIPPMGTRQGTGSGDGAAVAFAVALDTPVEGVTVEASATSPPGDTRLNGKTMPNPPPGWRRDPDIAERYGRAIGMPSHRGEPLEAFVARIDARLTAARNHH